MSSTTVAILITLIVFLITRFINRHLRNFPGPRIAAASNLWRMYHVFRGDLHLALQSLHEHLGDAVRIGPNVVSLSDPGLIQTIFRNESYIKSEFYKVGNSPTIPSSENIFSTRSASFHKQLVKPILPLYTGRCVQQMEPLLRQTFSTLRKVMLEDMSEGPWRGELESLMERVCADATMMLTFSQSFGFIKARADVQGTLAASRRSVAYMSLVGMIPYIDNLLRRNPILKLGPPAFESATHFAQKQIQSRKNLQTKHAQLNREDYLDKFLQLQKQQSAINDRMVFTYVFAHVVAGSDTVAAGMDSILRNILVHRHIYERLENTLLAVPIETDYTELKKIEYLSAVIYEALRLIPPIPMPLERVVPTCGLYLPDGRFLPAGTIVAMSPWILNRQPVYGLSIERFHPERWMRGDDESQAEADVRIKAMKTSFFTFGSGRRRCLGQELALMQLHVLIFCMMRRFKMRVVDAASPWQGKFWFFAYPEGTKVEFTIRKE